MKKKKLQTTSNIFEKLPWNVLTYELLQYYEFPYDIKDSKQGIQQLFLIRRTRMVKKKVMKDGKEIEIEEEEEYMKVVVFFPTIIIKGEEITSNIFNKLYYRTLRITFLSCRFNYFDSDDLLKMNSLTNLTFYGCLFIEITDTFKLNFPKKLEVFKMQYTTFHKELITIEGIVRLLRNKVIVLLSENTILRKLEFTETSIKHVNGIEKNKNLISLTIDGLHNCDFLKKMTHLEYLNIRLSMGQNDLTSMKEVNYPYLKEINIVGTLPLAIPNFGIIPNVKTLKFNALIPQNKDLSILNGFTNLEELNIKIVVRLVTTQEDGWPQFYSFSLKKLKRLKLCMANRPIIKGRLHKYIGEILDVEFEDITFLSECYNIEYLKFTGKLKSLNGLDKLNRITEVDVDSNIFNTTIPIINKSLEILMIDALYEDWNTFKVFIGCENLEKLCLYGIMHSFNGIDKLKKLKTLSLINNLIEESDVKEPHNIQSQSLKKIVLNGFKITNLYFLKDTNITTLILKNENIILSIDGIQNMFNLKELHISSNMSDTITEEIPIAILVLKNLKIYVEGDVEGVLNPLNPREFYSEYNY